MSDDNAEFMSWWTPEGWRLKPAPAEYVLYRQSETSALEDVGYHVIQRFGDPDDTAIELNLYQVDHGVYWLVDIWTPTAELAVFFIEKVHCVPFVVDKLAAILRDFGIADYPSELSRIRRALIAFIRHGQSERTIDESGLYSRDDAQRDADNERRRREQKLAAERAERKAAQP